MVGVSLPGHRALQLRSVSASCIVEHSRYDQMIDGLVKVRLGLDRWRSQLRANVGNSFARKMNTPVGRETAPRASGNS
jgi:hypothetical protein